MNESFTFYAPGRVEISGNHTDHQHGCVLAAAVNLNTSAEVRRNGSNTITVISEGYEPFCVDLSDLAPRAEENNTTAALVRGIASAFRERGCVLGGFEAKIRSTVLPGSGLSSSAAFEVLFGRILNGLFFDNRLNDVEIAQIGQYAENVYFGKPCGLMDQLASSVGGLVYIDFENSESPAVEKIEFDFAHCGHTLCVVDCGADHANLSDAYASIPNELKTISNFFGKEYLREVNEQDFYQNIIPLRKLAGDRAVQRAIHVFEENQRVKLQVRALKNDCFDTFLRLVEKSGQSSWMNLQNVICENSAAQQEMAVALTLCNKLLNGRGAVRVHGGGFAGTALAFVPNDMLSDFCRKMNEAIGKDCCHIISVAD